MNLNYSSALDSQIVKNLSDRLMNSSLGIYSYYYDSSTSASELRTRFKGKYHQFLLVADESDTIPIFQKVSVDVSTFRNVKNETKAT